MARASFLLAAIAAFAALPAAGQQGGDSLVGRLVEPKGEIILRAEPPGVFFKGKGADIGMVGPQKPYRVLQQVTVPTVTGTQSWLKVQSVQNMTHEGWIFNGRAGDTASANVNLVPQPPQM